MTSPVRGWLRNGAAGTRTYRRALDQMVDFVKKLWILNREIVLHEADHVVVLDVQQAH